MKTPHTPEKGTPASAALNDQDYLALASCMINAESLSGPVPVDPDIAEAMGAFAEDALSSDDALDSHFDGVDPTADAEGSNHG
ncbi:hypothetical protein SAMN02744133_102494 [Thalassospira xiamenensis M-5 = DSM 17429]|uniref:Uncharacterized protein n=1 Tax=Thalassospira xiamenensis M-5 = DSM 17429 TaxID=1123366 RepID=A0AB72U804_9PROT|nr:hypothetical protein [Thalassospira xiamenensis]AJD50301.1 hypothetical protein TH3_00875 [Thalassospira xiamenensis M-5 = DSM 17429]SIS81691.1 hypothetical protein SAMN02744133_102494 [Thalassospira xiamenensis M-5 = DSM 17429]